MGAASEYLRALAKAHLEPDELSRFVACVADEPEKNERQAAVDHLLRVVDLTPNQVVALASTEIVRRELGLQLSVRRYAASKQYEAGRLPEGKESMWKMVNDLFS
jgi:hypothetical protein